MCSNVLIRLVVYATVCCDNSDVIAKSSPRSQDLWGDSINNTNNNYSTNHQQHTNTGINSSNQHSSVPKASSSTSTHRPSWNSDFISAASIGGAGSDDVDSSSNYSALKAQAAAARDGRAYAQGNAKFGNTSAAAAATAASSATSCAGATSGSSGRRHSLDKGSGSSGEDWKHKHTRQLPWDDDNASVAPDYPSKNSNSSNSNSRHAHTAHAAVTTSSLTSAAPQTSTGYSDDLTYNSSSVSARSGRHTSAAAAYDSSSANSGSLSQTVGAYSSSTASSSGGGTHANARQNLSLLKMKIKRDRAICRSQSATHHGRSTTQHQVSTVIICTPTASY
jgi:hypothetical protein